MNWQSSSPSAPRDQVLPPQRLHGIILVAIGFGSWLLYAFLTWFSTRFTWESVPTSRPIVTVVILLGVATIGYLVALRSAVRLGQQRFTGPLILLFAVSFRLVLLFSWPIQEIDLYRYIWDGHASQVGVSPFRYAPSEVLSHSGHVSIPPDLQRLVQRRDASQPIAEILSRIHFNELPTVYPPVSQAVFSLAVASTPLGADLWVHVVVMKAWIVVFDVFTLLILMRLLRLVGKPVGWSLAYGWCPLVLKEFANSGHLDSIAVCLVMLAIYMLVLSTRHVTPQVGREDSQSGGLSRRRRLVTLHESSVILGLAVGAKIFPLVLGPLWLCVACKRFGALQATLSISIVMVVSAASCFPLIVKSDRSVAQASPPPPPPTTTESASDDSSRTILAASPVVLHDPGKGLKSFLTRWKINDFIFLVVSENLELHEDEPTSVRPWFVVTSENFRQTMVASVAQRLNIQRDQAPFLITRAGTGGLFLILAGWFGWRAARAGDLELLLRAAFLTLAWFWLLLPTQNPWYWTWALPLIPFARSRIWLLMSGLVLLYYLRFYLEYHWPQASVAATSYTGTDFFDYVVVWFEYAPWFALLMVDGWRSRRVEKGV